MSLDSRELGHFVTIAREVVRLIDATTIAITDVPCGLTRNQIAVLCNRYYSETPGVGTPATLSES